MAIIEWLNQYKGELAALTAAFLWAASSTVYGVLGQTIPPKVLNLSKGLIAIALIVLTLILTGKGFPPITLNALALLMLSGAIGIGLGDTVYFLAINAIGPRKTLLLETLAPPIAAFLALFFLQETLSYQAWCGILLTLLGVAWVVSEKVPASVVRQNNLKLGVFWGLMAGLSQATGAVISRFALVKADVDPLYSTLWRLIAGCLTVLVLIALQPSQEKTPPIIWSGKLLGIIAVTAFGSTFLGIWLQQTAFKEAPTGIAQTLISTSPVFVLPITACLGDKITLRAFLGVLVALGGITLLFI